MPYRYTPYVLPLLLAAAVSIVLGLYTWRRRKAAPCATTLALLGLAAAYYCLSYTLEIAAAELPTKIFWAKLQYLSIATTAPLFLAFALQYTGLAERFSRLKAVLVGIVPAVTIVLALSNEAHGLIWSRTSLETVGPAALLVLGHGAWFWVHCAYSLGLFLAGLSVLAATTLYGAPAYRPQGIVLLAGFVVPMLSLLAYALDLAPIPHLNPTGMAFTLSVALFAIGIFRFQLLDLVPVARQILVARMPDGVLVVDPLGRIADLNPALAGILGQPAARLIGQPVDKALAHWPQLLDLLHAGQAGESEIAGGQGKAGCHYSVHVTPMRQPGTGGTARLVVLRDITRLKQLEEQFLWAQKLDLIGRLAGGVAHDLNGFLTATTRHARLARDTLSPEHPARPELDQILSEAEQAGALARQLLTFSQRPPAATQPVNLNQLVLGMEQMLQSLLGKEIRLVIVAAPNLGLVQGDPSGIEQAIVSLAMNARETMPNGGTLTIETANVTVERHLGRGAGLSPGEYVTLDISDTGVGMSEEVRAHLFEPFFSPQNAEGGRGLGLATVFAIVRQHSGAIAVHSEPGRGSRFRVYLPCRASDSL